MTTIAMANRIQVIEERLAALEAAFSRPRPVSEATTADLHEKVLKLANDVQGLKMRMGKKSEA